MHLRIYFNSIINSLKRGGRERKELSTVYHTALTQAVERVQSETVSGHGSQADDLKGFPATEGGKHFFLDEWIRLPLRHRRI